MLTKMYIPKRNIVLKDDIIFKQFNENIKIKNIKIKNSKIKNSKIKNNYKKDNILINFINSWL